MIADHGARHKYEHEVFGFNSRMDSLQAVVLSAKLRRLAQWNASRPPPPPAMTTCSPG